MGVSLAATNSDQGLIQRDIGQKRAYAAAQAGIADYTYHLNNDSGYWTRCTGVPTPNAVNQQGAISRYRPVDPTVPTGPQYAHRVDPGQRPVGLRFEQSDRLDARVHRPEHRHLPNPLDGLLGTPGAAGTEKQSIVATYKQATFLDYVYFTQLETSDPVTYGYANPSAALTGRLLAMHEVPPRRPRVLADPGHQRPRLLRPDRLRRRRPHRWAPAHERRSLHRHRGPSDLRTQRR